MAALPCHIHALNKVLLRIPSLKEKILFKIGLICDRTMVYSVIRYLANEKLASESSPYDLIYRDKTTNGYPGDVSIITDETKCVLPSARRHEAKDFFTPARCRLCFDKLNVFADITVGDPHGLPNIDRINGETAVIARTPIALELIEKAISENYIALNPSDYCEIAKGQGVDNKKRDWYLYAKAWKAYSQILPDYSKVLSARLDGSYARASNKSQKRKLELAIKLTKYKSTDGLFADAALHIRKHRILKGISLPYRKARSLARRIVRIILSIKQRRSK